MLINEKVNKKTSFPHFLLILTKKEFVYPLKIEFLCNHFIILNESKFMLSKLNSISLIRKFGPIYWSNREAINFQREVRLFFVSEEAFSMKSLIKIYLLGFSKQKCTLPLLFAYLVPSLLKLHQGSGSEISATNVFKTIKPRRCVVALDEKHL